MFKNFLEVRDVQENYTFNKFPPGCETQYFQKALFNPSFYKTTNSPLSRVPFKPLFLGADFRHEPPSGANAAQGRAHCGYRICGLLRGRVGRIQAWASRLLDILIRGTTHSTHLTYQVSVTLNHARDVPSYEGDRCSS
jgi:hypothetical protein